MTLPGGYRVVVFNIGGGAFRLVPAIHYNRGIVYIRKFLTHSRQRRLEKRPTTTRELNLPAEVPSSYEDLVRLYPLACVAAFCGLEDLDRHSLCYLVNHSSRIPVRQANTAMASRSADSVRAVSTVNSDPAFTQANPGNPDRISRPGRQIIIILATFSVH